VSLRADVQEATDLEKKVQLARLFKEPLCWVGETSPSSIQTSTLWEIINSRRANAHAELLPSLEDFIAHHPNSPWTPSIRANLAYTYRAAGLYSQALVHWPLAWDSVKDESSPLGKRLGDYILVNWGSLLSSLGRVETLEALTAETQGRNLSTISWARLYNRLRHNVEVMKQSPGTEFRCGTYALSEVSKALGGDPAIYMQLREIPSPPTGFSMAQLMSFVDANNLHMLPVRRPQGKTLVVPSVIHWKENHYAAIVSIEPSADGRDRYEVIDPTFGRVQWLPAQSINSEASGKFMVPAGQVPEGWILLNQHEIDQTYGKGACSAPPDPEPPPCPEEGQDECTCLQPGGGGGPGSGPPSGPPNQSPPYIGSSSPGGGGDNGIWAGTTSGSGSGGCGGCGVVENFGGGVGMPSWRVSEPHIALWLYDTPMTYNNSLAQPVQLRMSYHTDETRPDDTNVVHFGPYWNCNFLSFIDLTDQYWEFFGDADPLFSHYAARAYGAGGGRRDYNWWDNPEHVGSFTTYEQLDDGTNVTSIEIHYRNGSTWTYGLETPLQAAYEKRFFLTRQSDPQGRIVNFYYTTNNWTIYLNHVVDIDGRTNTLFYDTNGPIPTLVTSILNPLGQSVYFKYDANRLMTNLVDAIGYTNSFDYTYTSSLYFLTNFTTLYGKTSFNYFRPGGALYGMTGDDNINRAIKVTEPNGAEHLFMYRDYTPTNSTAPHYLPCEYDDLPSGLSTCDCIAGGAPVDLNNHNMHYRNTFYWGPKQVPLLSENDLTQLIQADYDFARLRNWLHGTFIGLNVGPYLDMERELSADGATLGQKTWIYYPWSGACHFIGTNSRPSYVAQRLNDSETRYVHRKYNRLGYVTSEETTYSNNGSIGYRTNRYEYADNDIDLLRVFDAENRLISSNAYNSFHQVLTNYNAAGELTTYEYDGNQRLTGIMLPTGLTRTYVELVPKVTVFGEGLDPGMDGVRYWL